MERLVRSLSLSPGSSCLHHLHKDPQTLYAACEDLGKIADQRPKDEVLHDPVISVGAPGSVLPARGFPIPATNLGP